MWLPVFKKQNTMAKGRGRVKKTAIYETRPMVSKTTVTVKVLRPMIASHRIPGRRDDVIEVPADLVDELVENKYIEVI